MSGGFDEFFGNLYHLNAEEDPESPNYPPPADFPHFRELFNLRTDPFKDFPPRQKAASFTIDQAMAKLEPALSAGQ